MNQTLASYGISIQEYNAQKKKYLDYQAKVSLIEDTQKMYDAVKDLLKPAELGFRNAQKLLGDIYASSKCETKDETESFKWYKKAAEQGHEDAKKELDFMEF